MERLSVFTDGFDLACILLALFDEARLCRTRKRPPVFANRPAFAVCLRHC